MISSSFSATRLGEGMAFVFLNLEEAIRAGAKGEFFEHVRREVFLRLLRSGRLTGKRDGGQVLIQDDEVFRWTLGLGIERFAHNEQGWAFTAFRAPVSETAKVLLGQAGVSNYRENIRPRRLRRNAVMHPDPGARQACLFQLKHSEWSILIQTTHGAQTGDMVTGLLLAAEVSSALQTRAVAAWDDDITGSTLVYCEHGAKVSARTNAGDWAAFYEFFYTQGIAVPETFIAGGEEGADLHIEKPESVFRADALTLQIPQEVQEHGAHVEYKLGMIEPLEEEPAPASEACRHVDGLWGRALEIRHSREKGGAT